MIGQESNVSPTATPAQGLTAQAARERQLRYGANVAVGAEPSAWNRALRKFWAPVPWMLEAAILLQISLHEFIEAGVIGALLFFNAALGWAQEQRAHSTLQALKSQLALMALVLRDGVWRTAPASELVPGDLVKLTLGSIVPADARLIEGQVLVDQSMLTGESLPAVVDPDDSVYAGSVVCRGEARAEVTAIGSRTRFGRAAELVAITQAPSTQQRAVLKIVRSLAIVSGSLVMLQLLYAALTRMTALETIPLILTAVLAAIPVALPATFTLASAVGARTLARRGVLLTRLAAVDEAATLDVLCADKTGTLTQNALAVTAVYANPGIPDGQVLGWAALASEEVGLDPVDRAIRAAASGMPDQPGRRVRFTPFDPAKKMSEAIVPGPGGTESVRVVKGAFARIAELVAAPPQIAAAAETFETQGNRVLGVAAGAADRLRWIGLVALSDPPRSDAQPLILELKSLGVTTVMVTGDAAATAVAVAKSIGLLGPVCTAAAPSERLAPNDFAVFAGVFPEGKYRIVESFQKGGHTVGMCGDGVNDAPALRRAQLGIAVSTANDAAKSAAGMVLTEPGLGGILDAIRVGRIAYQRILTYTLRSVTAKVTQLGFLTAGLWLTGHAILTPMLMVLIVISGDFLAMSATTDHVDPAPIPNVWRIGAITRAGLTLGLCNLVFCVAVLLYGERCLGLVPAHGLRSLAAIALVFSSQAAFYVVRERRRLWSSRPSPWVIVSTLVDVAVITFLAGFGVLMHPLPWTVIIGVLAAAAIFAIVLDQVKFIGFAHLRVA